MDAHDTDPFFAATHAAFVALRPLDAADRALALRIISQRLGIEALGAGTPDGAPGASLHPSPPSPAPKTAPRRAVPAGDPQVSELLRMASGRGSGATALTAVAAPAHPASQPESRVARSSSSLAIPAGVTAPRDFFRRHRPTTHVEAVTSLAWYLQQVLKRDRFTAADVTTLAAMAGLEPIARPNVHIHNATTAGYFESVQRGERRLTAKGASMAQAFLGETEARGGASAAAAPRPTPDVAPRRADARPGRGKSRSRR